jgi:hypothetical protein
VFATTVFVAAALESLVGGVAAVAATTAVVPGR